MVTPSQKLAESLERLEQVQKKNQAIAIRSKDLSRTDRERLVANGFLLEVMKGWYISSSPSETEGESTAWYTSFWSFCTAYLNERFSDQWCLSPEQSLSLHSGNWSVPKQLAVRSPKAGNKVLNLPHGTSLLDIRLILPSIERIEEKEGVRVFSLESALIRCSPDYFVQHATDARTALSILHDSSVLLSLLLEEGHSIIAGRLIGAFRNIGRDDLADVTGSR